MSNQEVSDDDLAEHILWMFAENEGLIDGVGGCEWCNRTAGTRLATAAWIDEHDRLREILQRDPDSIMHDVTATCSEELVRAIIKRVFAKDHGR